MNPVNDYLKNSPDETSSGKINRRDFIKFGGMASGLLLAIGFLDSKIVNAGIDDTTVFEPSVYLKIGSDGKIIIFSKNPEIGQGVKTSFPQIIAEELEVDWKQIEVRQGILDARFGAQFAGGSGAIKGNFETLRKAGASAREMLIEAASRKWQVSLNQCYAKEGFVFLSDSNAKLSYAELAESAAKLNVRENPALKNREDFKIIGTSISGVDNRSIVTGKAEYGIDSKPKGMLTAVIQRCPVYGGKIKNLDDSEALRIAGVERIIKIDATQNPTQLVAGVAVIAKNTWTAIKARRALKIEWDFSGDETESDESLRSQFENKIKESGGRLRDDGNTDQAFTTCAKIHEAVFEAPFLAHVTMEPMNYIADVRPDGADLWGPTQVPGSVRAYAAEMTGLARDKINVRMTRVGGGFGRRLMADYACEAIYLSKTIGKPVQVVWTREDDIQHDFFRPAGLYKLKAGLDERNRLVAWELKSSTTSRRAFSGSTGSLHETEVFPDGFPAGFVPNFRMEYTAVASKVPRGAWRGPGHNVTAWLDQTFIDEMAVLAGKNPVDFRFEILGEENKLMPYRDHGGPVYSTSRLKNVMRVAAEKADWYKPAPAGIFRGFASHFMFGAYVAEVVSISMPDKETVKIENVMAVVDCGLVINRSGAINQLEGGIIDGLSAAMNNAVNIRNGRALQSNFDNYKLMRIKDAPKIEVYLVESKEDPEGLGEMSLPPVTAALCNAIYAATGKRIRKLPINLNDPGNS